MAYVLTRFACLTVAEEIALATRLRGLRGYGSLFSQEHGNGGGGGCGAMCKVVSIHPHLFLPSALLSFLLFDRVHFTCCGTFLLWQKVVAIMVDLAEIVACCRSHDGVFLFCFTKGWRVGVVW